MISTLNERGGLHSSCEDSIGWWEDDDYIYGICADGCSTGHKSHWASQTFVYLFNKGHKDPTTDYKVVHVFQDLKMMQLLMSLDDLSLVSTCMLFSYDKEDMRLKVRVFGDGCYFVNDVEYNIDQGNQPDYLAYQLREDGDISSYLQKYPTKVYEDVSSFRICSDGIDRIERGQFSPEPKHNPLTLLLHPPSSENYLKRQMNILKKDGWTLGDDLSIISYVRT